MSDFNDILTIGFDKNGEADYRASFKVAELDFARMKEFRAMIPVAIKAIEQMWWDHGPPSKEMAKCSSAVPPQERSNDTSRRIKCP